jgi:hypothetical protein
MYDLNIIIEINKTGKVFEPKNKNFSQLRNSNYILKKKSNLLKLILKKLGYIPDNYSHLNDIIIRNISYSNLYLLSKKIDTNFPNYKIIDQLNSLVK